MSAFEGQKGKGAAKPTVCVCSHINSYEARNVTGSLKSNFTGLNLYSIAIGRFLRERLTYMHKT